MFEFRLGTRIFAGENVVNLLGDNALEFGTKALVVTDQGIIEAGLLNPLEESMKSAGLDYCIYDGVVSNPTVKNVEEATGLCLENNCDVIIALGGGSSIDCAKGSAVVAKNGGVIYDYNNKDGKEFYKALPIIAVPTTCGTGSEVSYGTVITIEEEKHKFVVVSPLIYPVQAYLDSNMVEDLPSFLVSATGIDALTHAIESFISKGSNCLSESLALHSIRLIGKFLKPAYAGDKNARFQMLCASSLAAMSFSQTGLGLVHAMAVTMGGMYNLHHGLANAVLLPYVMSFNRIANEQKYIQIAEALGENTMNLSVREGSQLAIEAVTKLTVDVGIPSSIRELGVKEEDIPELSLKASVHPDGIPNPRHFTSEDIKILFRKAY